MLGFVGYHLKYILSAVTTLEHRVILEHKYAALLHSGSGSGDTTPSPTRNPFDQGWNKNLVQLLGPNLLLVFLPWPVKPPPPFLPDTNVRLKNS